jgi:hypothetical protein
MKKYLFTISAVLLTVVGFTQTAETTEDKTLPLEIPRHFFHLDIGYAIAGGAGVTPDSTIETERTQSPVFGLGYDYNLNDRISLGVVAAYQRFNSTVNDTLGALLEEGAINRIYTGARFIVHYGKGDVVRFYSGFRGGLVFFNSGNIAGPAAANSRIEDENNRYRISIALIPIAMRLRITEEFGAHLQTNFGAPYWFNLGLNYTLK